MKKLVVSILVSLIATLSISTIVNAASSSQVVSYLRAKGGAYVTEANIVKLERYFKENPITASEGDALIAKIDNAKAIIDASGTTNLKNLTNEDKDKLKAVANEAAAIVGVSLTFNGDSVQIYKNGKLIDTISSTGKLAYTGNEINYSIVAISAVAIIALATGAIFLRKKLNYAK